MQVPYNFGPKLHLIVPWFASHVGLFYLLITSEALLLGLAKSIY